MVRAASKKPWALHLRQPLCDVADALRTCRHGALSSTACGLTVVMPTMGAPACSKAWSILSATQFSWEGKRMPLSWRDPRTMWAGGTVVRP